jgi:flagellar FliJ protein
MKKFKFRLEALLSYRKHLERNAQQEVVTVQGEIISLKDIIEDINKEYDEAEKKVAERAEGGINGELLRQYTNYFKGLEFQRTVLGRRVGELEKMLKQKQKKLKEKSVEKKVLENLRTRKNEEYYQEMFKNEMKEADETTLLRRNVYED